MFCVMGWFATVSMAALASMVSGKNLPVWCHASTVKLQRQRSAFLEHVKRIHRGQSHLTVYKGILDILSCGTDILLCLTAGGGSAGPVIRHGGECGDSEFRLLGEICEMWRSGRGHEALAEE